MQFSHYQNAVFDFVKSGKGNAIVSACAGSGKTSTLVEALKYVPAGSRICFLAFNKAIAEELKRRVPPEVNVQTFHALGWSVINNKYRGAKLDNDKSLTHIKAFFDRNHIKHKDWAEKIKSSNRLRKIIDFLRLMLIVKPTRGDIRKICHEQDIEIESQEMKWVESIYQTFLKDNSCYDFVDMLFIPLYKKMDFPKFDFIAIDECQDLSIIQHKMFFSCMNDEARFLAVGDKFQAIFAFAGANHESYDSIKNYPNTIELPLSISYRCGKRIIEHAQKLVPHIEHFDGNGDGEVIYEGSIKNIKDEDVVLCRTNVPLVSLACKFLKEGKRVKIKGADFGKNLVKLIKETGTGTIKELNRELNKNLDKLIDKIKEDNPLIEIETNAEYQRASEKTMSINALCDNCDSIRELNQKIESIFSDSNGSGIILSTIHKFKGLEAKNVFILEPQLIPFPFYLHLANQREVENNLDYVARTRAINKLEYIRDWSIYGKKKEKKEKKILADQVDFDSILT